MTLGLFVVLFGIVPPITVHADPITVLGTFNFLDVRSPNTAGLAIGSRNSFGLDVTPNPRTGDPMTSMSVTRTLSEFTPNPPLTLVYLDSPALPNQYALSFPCGTTNDPCRAEGLGPPPSWLQGPWRFTITNPNSPNSPVVVDTAPLGEVIAPPFVASMAIAPGPTPTQPRFSWTYPGTGIFDSVAIFIQNLDDRIAVGNSARIIHVDFGVPTSVNTYEVPQTLSGGGSLQAGVHYTVSIQLTRRRLDFSLWARSTAFFDFVLGGVETVPAAFLPTVGPDGVYHFNVSEVGPGQVIFIDPQVAIGYDYAIGVGDPNFASVVLPEGIGDEQYGVYLFNARGRAYKVADVAGGVPFAFDAVGFPNGVDRFRVLGIEAAAGLDPRNVTAFVTGVSFVDGGHLRGR
jgi:hypothetical protein